jgi:hypothetical protein
MFDFQSIFSVGLYNGIYSQVCLCGQVHMVIGVCVCVYLVGREAETLPRIVGSADDQARINLSTNIKLDMADFIFNIPLCIY